MIYKMNFGKSVTIHLRQEKWTLNRALFFVFCKLQLFFAKKSDLQENSRAFLQHHLLSQDSSKASINTINSFIKMSKFEATFMAYYLDITLVQLMNIFKSVADELHRLAY